ncbi:fucose-specific lectin [Hypomontagnella monticulosa]|nr:fucose-specific lectin [Hypomontagnella monticulosa]
MASYGYHGVQPDQPGLEVVHNGSDGLVVIQQESEAGLHTSHQQWLYPGGPGQAEKEVAKVLSIEGKEVKGNSPPPRWNTKKILLIALVCVLVVVGVVVGSVVGTRAASSSSSPPPPPPPPPPPTTSNSSSQGDPGSVAAEMTGTPTSVTPGFAPTAISWGYPHLEVYALTNNNSYSIYRKYRNSNATSETDFLPSGSDMELVGGGIDFNSTPSISVSHRMADGTRNFTEIHINGKGSGYIKYHDNEELLSPDTAASWYVLYQDPQDPLIGAPKDVVYKPSLDIMKAFYMAKGDNGNAVFYFQYHVADGWSNKIQIPGPDLQPMTPGVVAWNGDDSRLDILAVSRANSHLLHASWDAEKAEWSAYEDLRGCVTTPPVVVSRSPGIIDVFARGGDGGLWTISYDNGNGGWANWTRISGNTKIQGQPDAISISSNTLDVFAWRDDGRMLHKGYDSTSKKWTPEDDFDIPTDDKLSGPPRALSDGSDTIHVFAYDEQFNLIWKRLLPSSQSADTVQLGKVPMLTMT